MSHTLPVTNIAPENGWLEDEIFFRDGPFSGAMLVLESVFNPKKRNLKIQTMSKGFFF